MAGYLVGAVSAFTMYAFLMVWIIAALLTTGQLYPAIYSLYVLACGFAFANILGCLAAVCFKKWWRHATA